MKELLFKLWVLFLTVTAGYFNVLTLTLFGVPTSHHTGSLSNSVIHLFSGEYQLALKFIVVIVSYLIGAGLTGVIFKKREFVPNYWYGRLSFISALILLVCSKVTESIVVYIGIISLVMGMQNAKFIVYNNIVIRTAHMSGNLSDLGLAMGHFLIGNKREGWKVSLFFMILSFYLIGCALSVILKQHTEINMFWFGAFLYILSGLIYYIYHRYFIIKLPLKRIMNKGKKQARSQGN